ncbi:MAG: ComF family protein [Ignavibacteriales bacterium]|nr:ComF family protein [Ignavibacteriales bacterium]
MAFAIKETVQSFLDSILDFVYPPLCISCGRLLESGREHVCPDCWSAIKPATRELSLFRETRNKLISSGEVDDLVSLFIFEKEGPFQKIAHALKYSGVQELGLELGGLLGVRIRDEEICADILVPVPLHKRKTRERGFNQALLIGRGVSEVLGIPVRSDLVLRKRWTETQTTLSKEERKENVENAFQCGRADLKGKLVIVIDDVITTGATIESVAKALKASGAMRVIAASAALAQ